MSEEFRKVYIEIIDGMTRGRSTINREDVEKKLAWVGLYTLNDSNKMCAALNQNGYKVN